MKCALCNERNGNTRCEGCNTLFCLPCMNKHHDQLAEQFQLLMDVRNEVKQALDVSRSTTSNRAQISCLAEIDAWEREIIQRIQEIAANARTNVNELMMKHINEITDRFEQMSVQVQQQQKEGIYLENDIERMRNQLDQLKNDIKRVNEKIRVDYSQANNIEWDTLLYIVEEELPNQATTKKKNNSYDSIQVIDPTNQGVTGTAQSASIRSVIHSIEGETQNRLCSECLHPLGDWKLNGACSNCGYRSLLSTANNEASSRPKIRFRSTSSRDDTSAASSKPMTIDIFECPRCSFPNSVNDISNSTAIHCKICNARLTIEKS